MRTRDVVVETGEAGWFGIKCPTCPLLPHLNALSQSPRPCTAGIFTNMQGAVPLNSCEHYVKNSAEPGKGKKPATIKCKFASPAAPEPRP